MRLGIRLAVAGIALLSFIGWAFALPPAGSGGGGNEPMTCDAPLVLANGKCVPCPSGKTYSATTKTCVAVSQPKCPLGTVGTPPNCHIILIQCPPNTVGTPGNCHPCPAGQHVQNGKCVS